MAREKKEIKVKAKPKKELKAKKDKKEPKGRISGKGKELLKKELKKIEDEKNKEMQVLTKMSKGDQRQRKAAEKLRKKVMDHFEMQRKYAAVNLMSLDLKRGSKKKAEAKQRLLDAVEYENYIKEMSWKEILDNFKGMKFNEESEELEEAACS